MATDWLEFDDKGNWPDIPRVALEFNGSYTVKCYPRYVVMWGSSNYCRLALV